MCFGPSAVAVMNGSEMEVCNHAQRRSFAHDEYYQLIPPKKPHYFGFYKEHRSQAEILPGWNVGLRQPPLRSQSTDSIVTVQAQHMQANSKCKHACMKAWRLMLPQISTALELHLGPFERPFRHPM